MKRFEFYTTTSTVSTNGGPYISDGKLMYAIPEEAQELLEPVLEQYNQDPMWYFDKLNFGRPPAPWAIACLVQEYSIAGHIAVCRPSDSGIAFVSYTQVPNPMPQDYVPRVGAIVLQSKSGLENAAEQSPLFQKIWDSLSDCSTDRRWLILADPLDEEWVKKIELGDSERWLSNRKL